MNEYVIHFNKRMQVLEHRIGIDFSFINARKPSKNLYMFCFETFRIILNPSFGLFLIHADGLRKIRNVSKLNMYGFLKAFSVLCKFSFNYNQWEVQHCLFFSNLFIPEVSDRALFTLPSNSRRFLFLI